MIDFDRMRYLMKMRPKASFRVEKAMARATKVTTVLTGMPRGGHSEDMADHVEHLIVCQNLLNNIDYELENLRRDLEPELETIMDPNYRQVMVYRYMRGYSVRRIMRMMCYSESHTFRILRDCERAINTTLQSGQNR